ncbi:hypothetical protein CFD26_108296 [Aspergillus turcosus]|uniref:Sialidase domain-containing protein n=1 Tax=Aspergillus turcosus TaxID=1245748 RepID=A0A421DBZ5_9EURO|nr:hypothetical protein CFD26_108296 [Aspergillus turcosus]
MTFLRLLALAPLALAASIRQTTIPTYNEVTIFTPPSDYNIPRVLYARNLELPNGDLLATWENYSPEPPPVYFPVYRSTDHGLTWKPLSEVHDTQYGYGMRYQPDLYRLPERIGSFPAGTVLMAGSAIPTDLSSTHIELYASHDSGRTWQFVSHIAAGGRAVPDNGLTPVWEPFLMTRNGRLICYYSDQRANATHGQKLVHQVSTDLRNWGPIVDDVAYPTYTDRPGMPVVAKLPNGKYIYTYEYGGFFGTNSYSFPVYFRISSDPENFAAAPGVRLVTTTGYTPSSSPYVVWSPYGGVNGTIIVNAYSSGSIFVNQALGEGPWREIKTPAPGAYTRMLRVMAEDPKMVLINGAGPLGGSNNKVTVTMINLETALA